MAPSQAQRGILETRTQKQDRHTVGGQRLKKNEFHRDCMTAGGKKIEKEKAVRERPPGKSL